MPIPDTLSTNPYAVLAPDARWRPGKNPQLRVDQLMPPMVESIRRAVKEWRDKGYPGISDTSRALLAWWFNRSEEDGEKIRYYFSQREAVESVIFLYEAKKARDKFDLLRYSSGGVTPEMMSESWCRYVIKMATGSGKTKVISLLIAWSYFHKLYEKDSPLSRNILLIAPNIIVLDRLYRDFEGLRIFYDDNVLPPNRYEGRDWSSDFQMKAHRQDEVRSRSKTGNLFLTNIHRVYTQDAKEPSVDDDNTKDYFLGKRPTGQLNENQIDLGEVVRDLDELLIINDEAHHIHDEKLAWFKSIGDIHNILKQKDLELSLQIDMTATPKHNNGTIFVQTISDYPLVEAIHQNVVKHPVIPDDESERELGEKQSANYGERFSDYIDLGVKEWRKAYDVHKQAGNKAILFLMTDDTKNCDALGEYLQDKYHDLKGKVLVIHTKKNGEITEATSSGKKEEELTDLRNQAATIDDLDNPYCAVVSVLVLREGWDVRNVTTVVGLRAYSSKSNILPEQTLGRGLRLMYPDQNDIDEKVSVIGSPAFVEFVKEIEKEGVKLERAQMGEATSALAPFIVRIDNENEDKNIPELDIALPVLSRRFSADFSKIDQLTAASIPCQPQEYKTYPPGEAREIVFRDLLTGKMSHTTMLSDNIIDDYSRMIGYFVNFIIENHKLVSHYPFLYEVMKEFIRCYLFGKEIDLEAENTLRNLSEAAVSKAIYDGFTQAINALLREENMEPRVQKEIRVTNMTSFPMKRPNYVYPPANCAQNCIADNYALEYEFAKFLDKCPDIAAFAKNYFAVGFCLDYVKENGAHAMYYPDFLVRDAKGDVWIIETKGRTDDTVAPKRDRLRQWCRDVQKIAPEYRIGGALFVLEAEYKKHPPKTFADLVKMFKDE